jgi:uncharacterized protein
MTTGTRKPGDFCWFNILTPASDRARQFFASLLGWTYYEIPGVGHGIRVGGRDVGGIFDTAHPATPPGTRPVIGIMIKVNSADDAAARVTALGGRAKPPFDIGGTQRMAVCFDPSGAEFDVMEPRSAKGTDVDSTLHGAPSWFELRTNDIESSTRFYTSLFNWTADVVGTGDDEYTDFLLGDQFVGGMLESDAVAHWRTYFTVGNVDETAREATTLGARITKAPYDIPDVGRVCDITSPQDVAFSVIRYET